MSSLFSFIVSAAIFGIIVAIGCLVLSVKYKRRAVRDVQKLCQGISAFFKEYGRYPIVDAESDEQLGGSVMKVLCGSHWITGEAIHENIGKLNPKLINFVECFVGRKTVNDMVTDPWDEPYNIAFDTNRDGITEIVLEYAGEKTVKRIKAPFVVWCDGPNRKNELGSGDDIASWNMQ